jgi:osmoprotectant transport system permease protein
VERSAADRWRDAMSLLDETIAWLTNPDHATGIDGIATRLLEHVGISALSMAIAIGIALPAGLYIGHTRRGVSLAVATANIGRAVPSLALIGLILPITQAFDPGLGFFLYPTLLAMSILAIPPILLNAYAGVSEVDAELVEAARGMGFTEPQILQRVEIPLALPVILGGIRSAAVQVIATTTLGALFGMGGLGRFIVDGIAQNDNGQLFGGVFLVALIAVSTEASLALAQWLIARRRGVRTRPRPTIEPGEPAPGGAEAFA